MDGLFREHSQCIKVYMGVETILDPIEKNVEVTLLNPLPIKAIVSDLTFAKAQWAMPGITADKTKEIIIEKKHRNLLLKSHRIEIDNEQYEGWRVNGKMQIRGEGNYLRVYVYIIKSS